MMPQPDSQPVLPRARRTTPATQPYNFKRLAIILLIFGLGGLAGFWLTRQQIFALPSPGAAAQAQTQANPDSAAEPAVPAAATVVLPERYMFPVSPGNIGPQLLDAGAIDLDRFVQLYQNNGQPLTDEQMTLLTTGSDAPVEINRANAYFLLNFFWALGLTNKNSLLDAGPMVEYSDGNIEKFASTGGWTLATRPITELYSSTPIVQLTGPQQARLEEVARNVYRPCCNNHTAFPDCNHGMAMLGLLELMAAQDATEDQMFEAAKYANAFWFPQQSLEIALVFQHVKGQNFAQADSREFVGAGVASAAGYQAVHQWLADNNLLKQLPNSGNSCGV